MICSLIFLGYGAMAQVTVKKINDPHIREQQNRMVITSWGNFLPKPKNFLGINVNPHYTMTWSWAAPTQNRRYRSGPDIRPLGPSGQQTQRMALNTILKSTSDKYKAHSDSVAQTALSELYNNSGMFSSIDPLWRLYYKKELEEVTDYSLSRALQPLTAKEREYLNETGVIQWYDNEMVRLQERLNAAFNVDMDRGSRVLAYHRIMKEYRKVLSEWNTHITWSATLLKMRETRNKVKSDTPMEFTQWNVQSETQLMRKIIDEAKKLY